MHTASDMLGLRDRVGRVKLIDVMEMGSDYEGSSEEEVDSDGVYYRDRYGSYDDFSDSDY